MLLRTSEVKKHYHIVYLSQEGTGISSDEGHVHQYAFEEPAEAIVDQDPSSPYYGQTLQEASSGGWIETTDLGHTHELEEYVVEDKKIIKTDGEIVEEIARRYCEARELEEDSREAGYIAEDFHAHRHWDLQKKKELESNDRAALTINKIEEKVDNLTGYQRQNRTDIKYLPTENGDAVVSDILNVATKSILEKCAYGREESKVFEDAVIPGRGIFNIYTDFERNFQGDIIVEKYKWDEVAFGEHEKEDLSDCEIAFKEKWFSLSKLKEMYPEHADKFVPESKERSRQGDIAEDWDKRLRSDEFINTATKKYKVVECQRKVFKRSFILVNSQDGFTFDAEGWKKEDVNSVKTISGFYKIPRTTFSMRLSRIASTILLEDDYIDDDEFSLVPLYAKYRNNEFWGKVEGVKDLQALINKAYSQFVDILNKTANYGWFYDDTTFPNKKAKENFKNNSSSAGFLAEVTDITRLPSKVDGVKFPVELVNAIAMFNEDMRQIMNVNLDMQGLGSNDSGVALRQKIVQQLIGNDFLFDNLSFAKKKIGQILLKKIAKSYTPERLLRIVANQNQREGLRINNRPFDEYDQEALLRILRDADLLEYDVIVSESASSPSAMMGNFLALLELAGKGVPIPPEAIMIYAPIPDKQKIIDALANAQQQQVEAEDKKYQTEILKTQIAQEGKGGTNTPERMQ